MKQKLYTKAQIQAIENRCFNEGLSDEMLMERAGKAVFDHIKKTFPQAKSLFIFCGSGNNGGDGYVAAFFALQAGFSVQIRTVGQKPYQTALSKKMYQRCADLGIAIQPFEEDERLSVDLIVDALLGIGFEGILREDYLKAINWINTQKSSVVSIDLPSGVYADTGAIAQTAVKADVTITLLGLKRGLVTGEAVDYTGQVICEDLNVPLAIFDDLPYDAIFIADETFCWPKRKPSSHKGDFGHVLVLGGDVGMSGAPRLAATAALKVGAGVVTVATHPKHAMMINITQPELLSYGISKLKTLEMLLKRATLIVLGMGLGQSRWSKKLFNRAMKSNLPMVIDADGLNLLAKNPQKKSNWILTPHPGEAARLLNVTTPQIEKDRFSAAKEIVHRYGGVCILKGAGTVISDEKEVYIVGHPNPWLGNAGQGDVLAGIVAGLCCQERALLKAAMDAVALQCELGRKGNDLEERPLLATDLLS